jgi:hypoxanthine phosphoribosyltransferase
MHTTHNQLASSDDVAQKIQHIATQIISDYPKTPLFVSLLRGANPFTSLLMFEIVRQSPEYHPELDYMMVRTYGAGRHAGTPQIVTDIAPSTSVNDRSVIIIDDVLDKGITADFVATHLTTQGATDIKLAVLCDKTTLREKDIIADYKCFTFNDNWLVGMGMDDTSAAHEGYRWLDEIWEVI